MNTAAITGDFAEPPSVSRKYWATGLSIAIHSLIVAAIIYQMPSNHAPQPQHVIMMQMSLPLAPQPQPAAPPPVVEQPVEIKEKPLPQQPSAIRLKATNKPLSKKTPKIVKKRLEKPHKTVTPSKTPTTEHSTATAPASAKLTAHDQQNQLPSTPTSRYLPPTYRVEPSYPARALSLQVEGEVVVVFDINQAGKVGHIRIIKADPPHLFDREVKKALYRWRYPTDNPITDKRITVRFKLNGISATD